MAKALASSARSGPLSPAMYRFRATSSETAAAILRDLVVTLLRVTGHAALADDARLCTSELITNVYRHTSTRFVRVDVRVHERHVTVWVHDDQPHSLPMPSMPSTDEGGLGLHILDRTAQIWGTVRYGGLTPRTKAVWFRLDETARQA